MPRTTALFSTGKAITGLAAISMGATLPSNSYITGTLSIVEPFSPDNNPHRGLVFTLKTTLDNDLPSGSTYTIDGSAATKRVHLKFRLSPSAYTDAVGKIMQADSDRLASREHPILLGHKVSIECSGLSVVTMNDDEKAVRRTLEGHGARWAVREGEGHAPFQLLADANIASTSWFSATAASPTPPTPPPALTAALPNLNAGGWPAVRGFEQVHAAAEAKAREATLARPLRPLSDFAPPPRALVSFAAAPAPSPARAPLPAVIPSACLGRATPSASPINRTHPPLSAGSPRLPIRARSRSPSPLRRIDLTAPRPQALTARSVLPPALPGGDSSNIDHPSVQQIHSQDKKSSSSEAMFTQESPPTPESNPRSSPRPHVWSSSTNSYDETDRAARRDFALLADTPDEGDLFDDLPPCGQPMPSMTPLNLPGLSPTQPMLGTRPPTGPTSFFDEVPMTFIGRNADFEDALSRNARPQRASYISSGDRAARIREQRLREAQEALRDLDGPLTGQLKRAKSLEDLSGSTTESHEAAKRPRVSQDPQAHSGCGSDRNATNAVVDVALQRRREAEDRALEAARQRALQAAQADRRAAAAAQDLRRGVTTPSHEYYPLSEVRPGHTLRGQTNVIAVVVESRPPSKKKDWIMSPALTDPSLQEKNNGLPRGSEEHFVVTLFRRQEHELPALAPGTVILLRGLVISEYNGKPKGQAYSNDVNTWAWLDHASKLHYANAADMGGAPLQAAELQRMKELHAWWRSSEGGIAGDGPGPAVFAAPAYGGPAPMARVPSGGGRKQCWLSELQPGMFYDAIFKILFINERAGRMAMELYVTDGTTSTYQLKNFRNVTGDLPPSAVYVLAIQNTPPRQDQPAFQVGNVLRLNNVRAKEYRGELETIWAEMITEEQDRMGYKAKRPIVLSKDASEAKEIEQRIRALKRGEETKPNRSDFPTAAVDQVIADMPLEPIPRAGAPVQTKVPARDVQHETAFHTIYRDEFSHPLSTVEAMLANQTRPNRFRVQARVKAIVPQSGDALARKWCAKCRRSLTKAFCQSCNDHSFAHAQWRYRFIVLLEALPDEGGDSGGVPPVFAAIIDHGEAVGFLPSLPPVSGQLDRPNDAKKNLQQVKEACRAAERVLMGPKYDGEWVRKAVEWSVERYDVVDRRGGGGSAGNAKVIDVFRVFGMATSTKA